MALTGKFLTALGLEGDKADEIISAHSETVTALKEERDNAKQETKLAKAEADKFKKDADRIPALEKELEDLKKAVDEADEKNGENAWKIKYDAMVEERDQLKADFDKFKNETNAKETKAAKEKAYKTLLKEAGVSDKRLDAVIRVTDLEKVKLDKDGNIEGKDDHIKGIKEEWADFIAKETEKGADTATPPANNGGSAKTKEEIMAIKDRAERQKAIADNPKLFGLEE